MIDAIPNDIIVKISAYLPTRNKIAWMSACRRHRGLIDRIRINVPVEYEKICNISWRRAFKHVIVKSSDYCNMLEDEIDVDFLAIHSHNSIDLSGKRAKSVYFYHDFNQPVKLPAGIQKVKFGSSFSRPVDLPEGLISAYLGASNSHLVNLPSTLKYVEFGEIFDQNIILPQLTSVVFGHSFNQPVILPTSLKIAMFGNRFNQLITLPEGLEYVVFGYDFNQPVTLPSSLRMAFYRDWYGLVYSIPSDSQMINCDRFKNITKPELYACLRYINSIVEYKN